MFIRLKYSFRTLTQLIQILMAIMHDLHLVNYIEMSFQCVFHMIYQKRQRIKKQEMHLFSDYFPPSNIIKK